MTNLDPHGVAFKQRVDAVNFMLRDLGCAPQVRVQLRAYLHQSQHLLRREEYESNLKGYRPGAPTPLELSAWRLEKLLFSKTEEWSAHQGGSPLN